MRALALKTKLFFIVLLLSATSVVCQAINAFFEVGFLGESRTTFMKSTAEGILDKIDRNLFERYGDVQAFSQSEPALSMDRARIERFMADMMVTYAPIYDLMMVVDANGKFVATSPRNKKGENQVIEQFFQRDFSSETWFKTAISGEIEAGKAFVEDLSKDQDVAALTKGNGDVMSFTAPIRNHQTGKIVGVWTNRVSWVDVIEQIIHEETKKVIGKSIPHLAIYLADQRGQFMLKPQGDLEEPNAAFKASLKGLKETMTDVVPFFSKSFRGSAFTVAVPSKGYSSYPGNAWNLIMQIPNEDSASTIALYLLLAAFGISLLGTFLAFRYVSQLSRTLTSLNQDLEKEAGRVNQTSEKVTLTSQKIAESSVQNSATLEKTAASIEEMTSLIEKNAQNSQECFAFSQKNQKVADQGKIAANQVLRAMRDIDDGNRQISDQVSTNNERINEVVRAIEEINQKTKVIHDIVFQTKLLSFNASVEAARAGESGKGFAVVAEEIGNLAAMSGRSAREIDATLKSSSEKVLMLTKESREQIDRAMAASKDRVVNGDRFAKECVEILDQVASNANQVAKLVEGIAMATKHQTTSMGEIAEAMREFEAANRGNSVSSQTSAKASNELFGQAKSMKEKIDSLRSLIFGDQAA